MLILCRPDGLVCEVGFSHGLYTVKLGSWGRDGSRLEQGDALVQSGELVADAHERPVRITFITAPTCPLAS